jgi:hypothetical protein
MQVIAGQTTLAHFDTTYLNYPVTAFGIKPGGFGIEDKLPAHVDAGGSSSMPRLAN